MGKPSHRDHIPGSGWFMDVIHSRWNSQRLLMLMLLVSRSSALVVFAGPSRSPATFSVRRECSAAFSFSNVRIDALCLRTGITSMKAEGDSFSPNLPKLDIPGRVGGSDSDWRIERARLVEQTRRAVLRRSPRHLSFSCSSAIVQQLGLKTKQEWLEWCELGEGWSPYVPRDPKTYYTQRGEWLGW